MERYQVILAYDGTQFQGFQRQRNARTVQGVLEESLQLLGWRGQSVLAAGRTDVGVHAAGQVVAFDLHWVHSETELLQALNAHLPPDVAARRVGLAPDDFHPRYAAKARRYQYRLYCEAIRAPLQERYAWRVWPEVSITRMQQATACLHGVHDFAAFGTPHRSGGSTVREISRAVWYEDGKNLVFEIVGNAFLYHMVRRLVFFLVKIGQGRVSPEQVLDYLENGRQPTIQGLAPAHGLYLSEVIYPAGLRDKNEFGDR
jgi:tRNA pseudouridine38-40 synthase